MAATDEKPSLKLKTARTIKWNTIDRFGTQLLYLVVGVVLANVLSQEEFGLVGVLLIFQAFATILTDGGFGMALLQKKEPRQRDFSTVFWFNLCVSLLIYAVLWLSAPLIARFFHGDQRLIPLSRWLFLSFVVYGLSLVQGVRLMKEMNVRQIAVANIAGLICGGAIGVWLALAGYGAWALVWQTLANAAVRTSWLWIAGHWRPSLTFSRSSLRHILPVGLGTLSSQVLNTASQYAYNFVIGGYYSIRAVGIYTQADKWSKMGSATMIQIITSSFVPLLSRFSDDAATHRRYITRINRFTALILFPAMTGLCLIGAPLFHTLFGHKWDEAIPLFQILAIRGIPVVLIQLYYTYAVSLGRSKAMVAIEIVKDSLIFAAILLTVSSYSVETLVWGQFGASAATLAVAAAIASSITGYPLRRMAADLIPFMLLSLAACAAAWAAGAWIATPWLRLAAELAAGLAAYLLLLRLFRIPELPEMTAYLFGRIRRHPAPKNN